MNGTVFKIEEFTVHDGPGTRVTVFLKGCPLRCVWCHNPEGMSSSPELIVNEARCTHCGKCLCPCHHEDCKPYGRCLHTCPLGLVTECGQTWEAAALAAKLNGYAAFIKDGGVTFSGGEPLLQADFVSRVSDHLPGIHKALQTSGHAPPHVFQALAAKMDYLLFDLKLANDALHQRFTGVGNGLIRENYAWLRASGIPYTIRVPLIPGITDTPDNLSALERLTLDSPVEFLDYNPMAGAKYPMVGKTFGYARTDGEYAGACATPDPTRRH